MKEYNMVMFKPPMKQQDYIRLRKNKRLYICEGILKEMGNPKRVALLFDTMENAIKIDPKGNKLLIMRTNEMSVKGLEMPEGKYIKKEGWIFVWDGEL